MTSALDVSALGAFIREQRENAEVSLRQLAKASGVSNPYLSQVERGLRNPSAEILGQIARALRISAETLYVQAGLLEERADEPVTSVAAAIAADRSLTERQRAVISEIYTAFQAENSAAHDVAAPAAKATTKKTSKPSSTKRTPKSATA
jgi:hypothetical protein